MEKTCANCKFYSECDIFDDDSENMAMQMVAPEECNCENWEGK